MLVRSGDLWHCANPACLSELAIGTTRDTEVDRVYCVCGAIMKKHYRPPGFHYLDFFRGTRTGRSASTCAGSRAPAAGLQVYAGTGQRERQEPG